MEKPKINHDSGGYPTPEYLDWKCHKAKEVLLQYLEENQDDLEMAYNYLAAAALKCGKYTFHNVGDIDAAIEKWPKLLLLYLKIYNKEVQQWKNSQL